MIEPQHRVGLQGLHHALSLRMELLSGRLGPCRALVRGKCPGARQPGRRAPRFEPNAHELRPGKGLFSDAVSDPVGTAGAAEAHGWRGGSDPPEKRPSLARTGLSERSLPGFILAGRLGVQVT